MQHPIRDAALAYAAQGFRVIPLAPGTKRPILDHWPERASADPDVVARYFHAVSQRGGFDGVEPNVGIVTGSGLAVLDIDTQHGAERPGWAPDTLTIRTASGGLHCYYAVARSIPNSVGRLGRGLDVRGERGQVAAPPSVIHVYAGGIGVDHQYVVEHARPIASIDAELLIPEDERHSFAGQSLRRFEYRDDVPVGERNNYLTSLAGYLFAQGEPEPEVYRLVRQESDHLGFTPRTGELESIVKSIARYHVDQPAI